MRNVPCDFQSAEEAEGVRQFIFRHGPLRDLSYRVESKRVGQGMRHRVMVKSPHNETPVCEIDVAGMIWFSAFGDASKPQ